MREMWITTFLREPTYIYEIGTYNHRRIRGARGHASTKGLKWPVWPPPPPKKND